ncbi:protein kinase C eta type, partial [Tachysurus ichikawai]
SDVTVSCLQLLTKNPTRRLGCMAASGGDNAVTAHVFFSTIDWEKLNRRELEPPFKPQIVSQSSDQTGSLHYSYHKRGWNRGISVTLTTWHIFILLYLLLMM